MMGNLSFSHKLCISVCWGLLLMYTAAERQYFVISRNSSWEQARNHCQVCYKEMVTLTPENTDIVSRMIDSDLWIGLRKYINYNSTNDTADYDYDDSFNEYNATNTSSKSYGTPWTRWANGDPLVFQNWHPGHPVFKSPLPKIDCCSCSCTCPAPIWTTTTTNPPTVSSVTRQRNPRGPDNTTEIYDNMTDFTGFEMFENMTTGRTNLTGVTQSGHTTDSRWTTTSQLPIFSTCNRSPMLPPIIPENNKNYIENSCVVILSFGPWAERVCSERRPFICYEDRFMGSVNVSTITSRSAFLQWHQGPGDLSHYRLQVAAAARNSSLTVWNLTVELLDLSFKLDNLTAGTLYNVQVFPVKCKRDLNPQNSSFYTIPGEVENLTVTGFTETSVNLSWKEPDGNYDFFKVTAYSLLVDNDPVIRDNITTNHLVFDELIKGNRYEFVFFTGVKDRTRWSENRSTEACTRPGKVTNLKASENSDTHLKLKWTPPKGNYTEFEVKAMDENMSDLNASVTKLDSTQLNEVKVENLPVGTMIKLFMRASSRCGLQGESENITTYTAPGPISSLNLTAESTSITATWDFDKKNGNVSEFAAELFLNELSQINKTIKDEPKQVKFDNLNTATNYTVAVYAVIYNLRSPKEMDSIFTLPSAPTEVKVHSRTDNSLTFNWNPPKNSSATEYNCTLSSDFWQMFQAKRVSGTNCSFTGLESGSNYSFEVSTLSDGKTSKPEPCTGQTVEDKVEMSLSMICSSKEPLYCDGEGVRKNLFDQMRKYISNELNKKVAYELLGETFTKT